MSHKIIWEAKSWSINATPYSYPWVLRSKTKAHHDANIKTEEKFDNIKVSDPIAK